MRRNKAIKLAVEAIELHRRRFTVGYYSFKNGFDNPGAERDFKKYLELTEAINELANNLLDNDKPEIPLATLDVMEHNGRRT